MQVLGQGPGGVRAQGRGPGGVPAQGRGLAGVPAQGQGLGGVPVLGPELMLVQVWGLPVGRLLEPPLLEWEPLAVAHHKTQMSLSSLQKGDRKRFEHVLLLCLWIFNPDGAKSGLRQTLTLFVQPKYALKIL